MRYELLGLDGFVGSFTEQATALLIAREWLREAQAARGDVTTVVIHAIDADERLVGEQIIGLREG